MLRIEVAVDHEPFPVDVGRLREAVRRILRDHGKRRGSISIAVVNDAAIHDVNRRFLAHDEPTDVISFVLEEDGPTLEGEIVLGADTAARVAGELNVAAEDELLLYAIHGTLHLVGYDDLETEPRRAMRAKERDYLRAFHVELPAASDD